MFWTDVLLGMQAGVNLKAEDKNGKTALDVARRSDNDSLIEAIEQHIRMNDQRGVIPQFINGVCIRKTVSAQQ